jgi:ketosteroid isomerase-like protein
MASQRTKLQVVEELFEAMKVLDAERVMAVMHPDLVTLEPSSLPYGGVHHGSEAFRENVLGAMLALADVEIHDMRAYDAGEVIVGKADLTFTSRATGRSLRTPLVEIYEVTDGLISRIDVYPKDTVPYLAVVTDA